MVIAVSLAVAKPWAAPDDDAANPVAGSRALPTAAGAPGASAVAASPTIRLDNADSRLDPLCFGTNVWLVTYVERWQGQTDRVWRALEPALVASGPDDERIPVVGIYSSGVTQLGWCAPVVGGEKPSEPVDVAVWLRSTSGASPIVVHTTRPVSDHSPFSGLYQPPGRGPSSRAASWPDGTYVFRYRENDGRERWFAVEVEIRPSPTPAL